ncbi:hypothetical protein A176_002562 [Myxococcus hansupus]|uniref:Uncharacterized protein n=1 Tax=Pseudomyxococcus hansupus TaxID=1297742 RepID=A0A0H4WWD9_9BACT|nr:hypothetical protein [Myxococcus hansupus]AKQ65650.1 hypothetical protein A176_002562 [Myxococcus hansupus]
MQPVSETGWPESLRPLYETVTGTPVAEALDASAQWRESFAGWVRGATLDERTLAQAAAWSRMDAGDRTPAELLFLLSSCSELLWPYAAPPQGLLPRLKWRQEVLLAALLEASDAEVVARVRRETEATVTTVLTRILKRHPESLRALVGDAPCTFDGRALRFHGAVEVDLRQVLGTGARSVALLEQLRALMPATAADGRDRLAEFIRTRASRLPWKEASEMLAERLFALATSPDGRGGMSGFLACYPAGRKEPDWCARAGLLLSRTLEVGGPPEVVENLCELLARFDAPPVDGLRGALGALVGGDFGAAADLRPVRFVLDHCQATLRKGEPGLVLTLLWLEERLFRAAVRQGVPDAFERRKRALSKLRPGAPGFEQLQWLAEECAELWPRFLPGGVRPGLDELAAWRHEVSERVGKKPMLRKAGIEFFLWCAPDAASSEAELTVLALVRTATDRRQVRRLKDHPSSRVRLRVRTLQSWLQGEGGKEKPGAQREPTLGAGAATLTEALRHLHVTRAVPLGGRTWLRDRDLEEALLGALARVEAEFSAGYPARFREAPESLAAGLLEGLAAEMERVKADLSALMSQGQATPRELTLSVRRRMPAPVEPLPAVSVPVVLAAEALAVSEPDVSEPNVSISEEPAPVSLEQGPVRTGVEVAFVVDVAVGDFLRTRRVVSLQVVKLEQRGEGQWLPAFKLGRELLDAQLLRTDSAFCLFLAPPFPRAECWVVPSRTVRALMESQRSLSGVTREAIQRVARPLSHWLLGDLVGLWTGDERPEAHARLTDTATGPDFIAEWRLG